ncbi:MAG: adenylosuccinate synthase [Oscillospiraceae bacterium]|nr:adenylosuccinate synthase [Oscillospiraceae bacterium]
MVKAIVGANWGDEGKGKITDMFAEQADVVIRFQGGANAGHTIINNYGRFALHTLPSGVFYPHITNIVGNGMALDIHKFVTELQGLLDAGVPMPHIIVSERAHVLMPYHVLLDTYEEDRLAGKAYGSTKSGIAPFYSDKVGKLGFQVCELFDDDILKDRLDKVCTIKNALIVNLYHKEPLDPAALYKEMVAQRELIRPYVGDAVSFVHEALKAGKTVLLEGQLGTMKDPDFGIYPMTTSSNTLAAYGCIGAGIPPRELKDIVVVTKAYSSSVGGGDFVTELHGDEADELRRRGGDKGEFGATTGRPRRVGWFDAVATRYGVAMQGATEVVMTCLDVLGYLDEIKVCTGYEIDGKVTNNFPVTPLLKRAKPVYVTLPGWKCDIRGITDINKIPQQALDYVAFIEKQIDAPIKMFSTGPERHEILHRG